MEDGHLTLEADGLEMSYGSTKALAGVSLSTRPGECLGLLGPNGAGKSTLMHILAGYLTPKAGHLNLGGQRMKPGQMRAPGLLGFVPQGLAIWPDLTARENLSFFGQLSGLAGKRLKEVTAKVLGIVGLESRADDAAKTFSGGMQRRLNLAIALLPNPQIVLCDEPTVGVDPQSRAAIFSLLEELREGGTTILYATHYMEEASRLCDRIAIIDHGQILAEGTEAELLRRLPVASELRVNPGLESAESERYANLGTWSATRQGGSRLDLASGQSLAAAIQQLESGGITNNRIEVRQPDLERVFLHLTGSNLRD